MIALVVFGLASLARLDTDEFPAIDAPIVFVAIPYPGASPDVVEREVVTRLEDKISAYLFPELRLRALARWLQTRLIERPRPAVLVRQPIQNRYTTRAAKAMLEANGLEVIDVLHTRRRKGLPLAGPWVVIYIARK